MCRATFSQKPNTCNIFSLFIHNSLNSQKRGNFTNTIKQCCALVLLEQH